MNDKVLLDEVRQVWLERRTAYRHLKWLVDFAFIDLDGLSISGWLDLHTDLLACIYLLNPAKTIEDAQGRTWIDVWQTEEVERLQGILADIFTDMERGVEEVVLSERPATRTWVAELDGRGPRVVRELLGARCRGFT